MVFYFTGTGNSLYIAKQIEKAPISIPQAIHQKDLVFSDDSIGIVAPIYGHELPQMVKDFMKKAAFHTDYFYLILTYGNRHGGAAELAEKFCKENGISVQYINVIVMPDNWLPAFDMNEQRKVDKHIPEHLSEILSDLSERKHGISPVTDEDRAVHQMLLDFAKKSSSDSADDKPRPSFIQMTGSCTGCGICARVCPAGLIHLENGKAVHAPGQCQVCLACVHACPQKALGLSVPEKNPSARYRNEHISLQELIAANHQV